MARTLDIARRREIAEQAFAVLRDRGTHRTTMSELARELGMKRPTLYHYFPDRGALFLAVLDALQARIERFVRRRMAQTSHPLDALDQMLRATVDFYEGERETLIAVFQLWAAESGTAPAAFEQQRRFLAANRAFLIGMVRSGVTRGLVRACDVPGLVDTVLTLVDGTQVQRVAGDVDLTSVLNFVTDQILTPLRLTPEAP